MLPYDSPSDYHFTLKHQILRYLCSNDSCRYLKAVLYHKMNLVYQVICKTSLYRILIVTIIAIAVERKKADRFYFMYQPTELHMRKTQYNEMKISTSYLKKKHTNLVTRKSKAFSEIKGQIN